MEIQLGAGNKKFDRIMWSFNLTLLLTLVVLSFYKIYWLYFVGIYALICVFQFAMAARRHYIIIEGDSFLIDHLYRPRVIIKKGDYLHLSRSWVSIPFSTEFFIHFRNGKKFLFVAGDNRIAELEKVIK